MSGNIHRHGNPDNPNVVIPGNGNKPPTPVTKTCPVCKSVVPASSVKCYGCSYVWHQAITELNHEVKLVDVQFTKPRSHRVRLEDVVPIHYVSRARNEMLKLSLTCHNGGPIPVTLSHFLDIEGQGSSYGKRRARRFWRQMGGFDPPPSFIFEALQRFDELVFPAEILVEEDGHFLKWRV